MDDTLTNSLAPGLAERILQRTIEAVVISDARIRVLWVNAAFTRITGYSLDDMRGNNFKVLRSGHHEPAFYQDIEDAIQNEGVWEGEVWRRRKNGEIFPAMLSITALRDADGRITHFVDFFNDVGSIKHHQARVEYLVNHDALTGVSNRNALMERLTMAMSRARRNDSLLAVMFVDLDRFKDVNDAHGHLFGDHVLVEASRRLRQRVRDVDTVARLGGDEFVVVLEDMAAIEDVVHVADAIIETFREPIHVDGEAVPITASVGVTVYPLHADSMDKLLSQADAAMYSAKRGGRNQMRIFGQG